MVRSWYADLQTMAKTNVQAAEFLDKLKKAETDDEKDAAKIEAREWVWAQFPEKDENPVHDMVDVQMADVQPVVSVDSVEEAVKPTPTEEERLIFDMSAAAFNPRLAKMGINREEELFLKGVCVRKLSHDDKILMRRSIYNKKHAYMDGKQQEFKKKRAKALAKAAKDPALIKYHNQRKYVDRIIEALRAHKNFTWMFTNIKGLTPEVMKELLQNPGNVNLFRAEYREFVDKFNKKYGE